MSLTPGVGGTAGTDQNMPDTSTNGSKVTSLGNGYSLVTWTTPEYDPVSQGMVDKTHSQIVPDKDAAQIGASASVQAAGISAAGANQRAAVQAEIDRAKNAADAAHNAALLALSQGNSEEARKQFAITSSETERYHSLDAGIRQQEQDLAKNKFGFDVYNKLADLASNPRNYMEQFFRFRGSPVPSQAGQYGNGGQQGIVPFEQFLPNFLQSAFGASSPAGAAGPSSLAAPASSNPRAGGMFGARSATGAPAGPLVGSQANPNPMPTPVQAGPPITQLKAGASAPTPISQFVSPTGQGAPGQQFQGVQQTPIAFNAHADAPIVGAPGGLDQPVQLPKLYADGGTLRMTEPHAIVNLLSGKVAAIAGEQRGSGPHGFVPETASFDGKAIIRDENDIPATQSPHPGDPIAPQEPTPPVPPGGASLDPGVNPSAPDFGALAGGVTSAGSALAPFLGTVPVETPHDFAVAPPPPPVTTTATTLPFEKEMPPLPPPLVPPQPPVVPPTPPGVPPTTSSVDRPEVGGAMPPTVTPPSPFAPPTPAPNPTPSFAAPSLSFLQQLQNLSQTPSGLGKNPTFLPENAAQANPIVASLMQNNAFPPFLQRIFAQQQGLAGLGTNVPQQTNLPPGVPLASRLAISQMSPSELAAFQSFISANGVDWTDYLNMVDAASPQGGASKLTAYPKYLAQ